MSLIDEARQAYIDAGGNSEDADQALAIYDRLRAAWESGDTSTWTGEAFGTYAQVACTAATSGAAAPVAGLCYGVGKWLGERFGEFLESLGARKNPCIENPASCVATDEFRAYFNQLGKWLDRAYTEAVETIADVIDPQPGGWGHSSEAIATAKSYLVPPDWPWRGAVYLTLEQAPTAIKNAQKRYAVEMFAIAADLAGALRELGERVPDQIKLAPAALLFSAAGDLERRLLELFE